MSDEQIFFDTNILVYANDVSSGNKQGMARKLITASMQAGNGSISTQVLAEFWVTVTKKLAIPLDRSLAERQLALLSSFSVVAVDLGLVLSAVKIQGRYGISYWDAQIIAATALAGCALIYSEDLKDGAAYDGIRVKNPFS
jgi:predicted nucleic acid-binding protein